MSIDYNMLKFWWDVVITIILVINTIYTWHVNRDKTNADAFKAQAARIRELESEMRSIKIEVSNLPNHNDLGALHEKVNDVASGMRELQGELGAINRTLLLINEHLINHGSRAR